MIPGKILIQAAVLEECRRFFQQAGKRGCEGTALLIGRPSDDCVRVTRALIPEQECLKSPYGIAVRLTKRAHRTLVDELQPGEFFYVRIHSHPREAFHSATDDENGVLTHLGAISIVVPYFARDPISLNGCAIYMLTAEGWLELAGAELDARLEIV